MANPRKLPPELLGDPDAAAEREANLFGLTVPEEHASLVLLGVPWDVTTSYRPGTARGPRLIQQASHQLDLWDGGLEPLGLGRAWRYGLHLRELDAELETLNWATRPQAEQVIEAAGRVAGNPELERALEQVNRASERLNDEVHAEVTRLLGAGRLVGLVGGEHSVAYGSIRAHAEHHAEIGVLQIDAHADLRHAFEGFRHSHASVFDNVLRDVPGVLRLTQVGLRDVAESEVERIREDQRVVAFFDHELRARLFDGESWRSICDQIVATLPEQVYVSCDIDGLDPALCPHTGTPVPGGLSYQEAAYLLLTLARRGRQLVGFDLVEVAGPGDGSDEWDGNVAARLLYRLCGLALHAAGACD